MPNIIHSPNKSSSPISPSPGNANSIFFAGGNSGLGPAQDNSIISRSRSRSPSPAKAQVKPNISITIDPAEDPPKEHFGSDDNAINGRRTSPSRSPTNFKNRISNGQGKNIKTNGKPNGKGGTGPGNGGASRKSRKDGHDISEYRRRYIGPVGRYYEPDRDLLRRQQAMIAVQPMTGLEEINYKRDMLRTKVENRRRADALSLPRSKTTTSLGELTVFKSQPGSRSPSPSRLAMDKAPNDFDISKKLADSTSQAIRVTKKVSSMDKKLTPKIVNKAAVVSKK